MENGSTKDTKVIFHGGEIASRDNIKEGEERSITGRGKTVKMLETMTTNSSYVGLEMNSPNAFKEFWFFF